MEKQVASILKILKNEGNFTSVVTPLRLAIRVIMLADFIAWISSLGQW